MTWLAPIKKIIKNFNCRRFAIFDQISYNTAPLCGLFRTRHTKRNKERSIESGLEKISFWFILRKYFKYLGQLKGFWVYRSSRPEGVLSKRCSENMLQIYRRTKQLYWNLHHGCSPVNLLYILFSEHHMRAPFTKNTSGWLPLSILT